MFHSVKIWKNERQYFVKGEVCVQAENLMTPDKVVAVRKYETFPWSFKTREIKS